MFLGIRELLPIVLLSTLPVRVLAGDVLSTEGFTTCIENPDIKVQALDLKYDKSTRKITFDVAGSSETVQNVTASLVVTAYGQEIYKNTFSPCEYGMKELCPVPASSFASKGVQTIPEEYASKIPDIAFAVPNLDSNAKLELKNDDDDDLACIRSTVKNGKTAKVDGVSYAAAGIAAAALGLSAISALAAGGQPGAAAASPTFGEVMGWFQSMAMNGMLSVNYPSVYQSFGSNFGFSVGLVPWGNMQDSIDDFRSKTGGNLTHNNHQYLKNATLVYEKNDNSGANLTRRAVKSALLFIRDGTEVTVDGETTTVGGDGESTKQNQDEDSKEMHYVEGIQGYVEQLQIPQANTFMTILLVFAIVVAAIIVGILLFKVILEIWALFGNLPKSLVSFRKRYWWRLAKTITNLILILYGVWVLWCVYQFTSGDSWGAITLAAVTLALFTGLLMWFTFKIWQKAQESKKMEGDAGKLFDDKETWVRYSLFYDSYKKSYWWIFVPVIVYMFAKGCVIAGANGHGLTQTSGQLIIEAIMLALLVWYRPYTRKSGNWINIVIHVARVLSVICILVFVEELGFNQTTQTVTGIVLIAVQGVLTAVLAILIAANALIACIKENPHRKKRKEAEKLNRDLDNLTPLDARNSLLMEPMGENTQYKGGADSSVYKAPLVSSAPFNDAKGRYDPVPPRAESPAGYSTYTDDRPSRYRGDDDGDRLVSSAASMGRRDRSVSTSPPDRRPTLPDVGYGRAY
ncbi:hypothetical protein MBLNU230_g0801t1 [Neophaeotheca triangularis]